MPVAFVDRAVADRRMPLLLGAARHVLALTGRAETALLVPDYEPATPVRPARAAVVIGADVCGMGGVAIVEDTFDFLVMGPTIHRPEGGLIAGTGSMDRACALALEALDTARERAARAARAAAPVSFPALPALPLAPIAERAGRGTPALALA